LYIPEKKGVFRKCSRLDAGTHPSPSGVRGRTGFSKRPRFFQEHPLSAPSRGDSKKKGASLQFLTDQLILASKDTRLPKLFSLRVRMDNSSCGFFLHSIRRLGRTFSRGNAKMLCDHMLCRESGLQKSYRRARHFQILYSSLLRTYIKRICNRSKDIFFILQRASTSNFSLPLFEEWWYGTIYFQKEISKGLSTIQMSTRKTKQTSGDAYRPSCSWHRTGNTHRGS